MNTNKTANDKPVMMLEVALDNGQKISLPVYELMLSFRQLVYEQLPWLADGTYSMTVKSIEQAQ